MTVEQSVEYLLLHQRRFERNGIWDKDRRGRDFCELIIKNPDQPSFPITVTVTENGCCVSVGQFEDVADSDRMTPDQAIAAINDILSDKIIFVLAYKKEDDIGFGTPYFSRIFAITGENDDMSEDYEKFIAQISTPVKKIFRPLTALKGRFVIFNFSGSVNKIIER
jgi:hypothetical protein